MVITQSGSAMTHDPAEKLCPAKSCNCWGFISKKVHQTGCPSLGCQCELIKTARQEGRDGQRDEDARIAEREIVELPYDASGALDRDYGYNHAAHAIATTIRKGGK